jgi:restriction endonuclease S subunit
MAEIDQIPFGDLAEFRNGLNFSADQYGSGVKFIGVADFKDYLVPQYDQLGEIVSSDLIKEVNLLKDGDILFVRSNGNKNLVGRSMYIKNLKEDAVYSGFCIRARPYEDKINSHYLAYFCKSDAFRQRVANAAGGANIQNLSQPVLAKCPIPVPDPEIQTQIVKILSAYDDLIENNLRRIKFLEEIAQLTYEQWSIYQKINGEPISEDKIQYVSIKDLIAEYRNGGWGKEDTEGNYTESAYVIRGTDMPDILSGNFNAVPKRYHTPSNLQTRALLVGDIIIEMSNGNISNIGRSLYFNEGMKNIFGTYVMCASFCKMARAKNVGYSHLINAHIKQIHKNDQMLVYKSQGANGINNFQFENMIEGENISLPTDCSKLEELVSIFDDICKVTSVLIEQVHRLRAARNILLPRLMTGTIDVESYDPAQMMKEAA